jgi:uncharacterized protein YbgA (DUF1722 family)
MERVNLFADRDPDKQPVRAGVGLFAAALLRRFPHLPVEEEGRLADPRLRENFIERLFAYHRLRGLWRTRWRLRDLVAFHTAHKMALLAHSTDGYRQLGRLVATAKALPRAELRARYEAGFMGVLHKLATPGRQANVLQHMTGHLRDRLDTGDRRELATAIDDHRKGLVPLIVPIVLLRHRAPARRPLPAWPKLPRAAPQGADVAQPRLARLRRRIGLCPLPTPPDSASQRQSLGSSQLIVGEGGGRWTTELRTHWLCS